MNKPANFVKSFEKTIKMLQANAPGNMSYAVIIYARDPDDKTSEYPDGITKTTVLQRVTPYDRYMIRQFVDEEFIWKGNND